MCKVQRVTKVQQAMKLMAFVLRAYGVNNPLNGTATANGDELDLESTFLLSEAKGDQGSSVLYHDGRRNTTFYCRERSRGWNGFQGGQVWRSFIETAHTYVSTGLQMLDPRFFEAGPSMSGPLPGASAECIEQLNNSFRFMMRKPSPGLRADG